MEVSCELSEAFSKSPMIPLAFRVHTHALGMVVSGWKVMTDN